MVYTESNISTLQEPRFDQQATIQQGLAIVLQHWLIPDVGWCKVHLEERLKLIEKESAMLPCSPYELDQDQLRSMYLELKDIMRQPPQVLLQRIPIKTVSGHIYVHAEML